MIRPSKKGRIFYAFKVWEGGFPSKNHPFTTQKALL